MWTEGTVRSAVCFIVLAASYLTPAARSEESPSSKVADPCFENLPLGWAVQDSILVPADQAAAIGRKLGAPIAALSNTVLHAHGRRIQVNLIDCPTEEAAKTIYDVVSATKGDPAFCVRSDKRVVEFVGGNVQLAIKTSYELGFVPKPADVRFRVTADLAPIDTCDYMSSNKLFNLFLHARNNLGDRTAKAQIHDLVGRFDFGDRITLRSVSSDSSKSVYQFTPKPDEQHQQAEGEAATYVFKETDELLGVPYVSVVAEITTTGDGLTSTARAEEDHLLAATEFWPVDDPAIVRLAQQITSGSEGREAKVDAILRWLTPGENIEFGGPVQGSRWGVDKVLEQRYGRCWDFADCFVSLCRASGIPCRQVAGWLYGASGHVWAEVLIDGQGWQQVDATGGGELKCGIYHIPWFVTETGEMPVLYVSMPEIEVLKPGSSRTGDK